MKTKLSILMMLPALMLASCGNGNEIKDEEKIKELKTSISAKVKDIKNYELKVESDSSSYDKESEKNISSKTTLTYLTNENDESFLKTTATTDGVKSEAEVYLVNNETYQKVLYTSTYNADTEKNDVLVYGYEGNEITFAFVDFYFIMPMTYFSLFVDPAVLDFDALVASDEMVAAAHEYETNVKYYSKGDGNLTIKADLKVKGEVDKDAAEYAVSGTYTVSYDNYYLKSVHVDSKSNKDNKSTTDITLTVKSEVKIELPKGWEDLINKSTADDHNQLI